MLAIPNILSAEELAEVRRELGALPFGDGRVTAGPTAAKVKDNQQADAADPGTIRLNHRVRKALMRSAQFTVFARPMRWSVMRFSRYGEGQRYGRHYDRWSRLSESGEPMRSDLSFTLFLNDPQDYDGGELRLDRTEGPMTVKLPAGAVFVYSTGVLHEVQPVLRGERLVCAGWVQSQLRSGDQREMLFDLERVRASMDDTEPRLVLDKTIGSLLRMWAEA